MIFYAVQYLVIYFNMILFLDFDGVLHPVRATIDQFFCHAPLLDTYLQRHHADAKIVLSTSWREPHSIEELLDFLPDTLHHRILGVTVEDAHPGPRQMNELLFYRSPRHAQILHYLHEHGLSEHPWMALDDDPKLFEPAAPQLVYCNPAIGLTPRDLETLTAHHTASYATPGYETFSLV